MVEGQIKCVMSKRSEGEKGSSSSCRAVYLRPSLLITPATDRTGSFSDRRGVRNNDLGEERALIRFDIELLIKNT